MIGLLLGEIGRWLGGNHVVTKLYVVSVVSFVFAAREWGWIQFHLPEPARQSEKAWAHYFGFPIASAMWGVHIGVGFATRINYGGFWVLVVLAIVVASPWYGAVLMLMYWLGRALPVWLGPAVVESVQEAAELPSTVLRSRPSYHRLAGLILGWFSAATGLSALLR
jgi:cytochrome c biogenesis protein CcdA